MYKHGPKPEGRCEESESRDEVTVELDEAPGEPDVVSDERGGDGLALDDEEPCGVGRPAGFFGGEGVRGAAFVTLIGGDWGVTCSVAMPAATWIFSVPDSSNLKPVISRIATELASKTSRTDRAACTRILPKREDWLGFWKRGKRFTQSE